MTAPPGGMIEARNAAGIWVAVPIAEIACVSEDDDQTDSTLLILRDESAVTLPEAYEDVLDRIVAAWPDHR